jgi:hypothetical protein
MKDKECIRRQKWDVQIVNSNLKIYEIQSSRNKGGLAAVEVARQSVVT